MSSRVNKERGAAALEFAGMLPLLVMAALLVLQVGVAGWTAVAAGQASRDAARAASLKRNPVKAANASLPGSLAAEKVSGTRTGNGVRYQVTVKIPSVVRVIDVGSVTRTTEMPDFTR